jgi:hypothetical protein
MKLNYLMVSPYINFAVLRGERNPTYGKSLTGSKSKTDHMPGRRRCREGPNITSCSLHRLG